MEKKKRRSLEEILDSLKDAEKEFDEKLDKYGLKNIKSEKPEEESSSQDTSQEQIDISNDSQ